MFLQIPSAARWTLLKTPRPGGKRNARPLVLFGFRDDGIGLGAVELDRPCHHGDHQPDHAQADGQQQQAMRPGHRMKRQVRHMKPQRRNCTAPEMSGAPIGSCLNSQKKDPPRSEADNEEPGP